MHLISSPVLHSNEVGTGYKLRLYINNIKDTTFLILLTMGQIALNWILRGLENIHTYVYNAYFWIIVAQMSVHK